jgi:hypothetical protein
MDRTASLLHQAAELRRRIFSALPWGVRFSAVFMQLASDTGWFNAWGKAIGALFLNAGVPDMPDPGPQWEKHPGNAKGLPNGYMADFMASVFRVAKAEAQGNPALAEEAISLWFARAMDGKIKLRPEPLATVKSYVMDGCKRQAKYLRIQKVRDEARSHSLQDTDEDLDKGVSLDLADPKTLDDPHNLSLLEQVLNFQHDEPHLWKGLLDYLSRHVHEDAGQYFQLLLEGYDKNEIIGQPSAGTKPDGSLKLPGMLTHYKPKPSDPKNYWVLMSRHLAPAINEFLQSKHINPHELVMR